MCLFGLVWVLFLLIFFVCLLLFFFFFWGGGCFLFFVVLFRFVLCSDLVRPLWSTINDFVFPRPVHKLY